MFRAGCVLAICAGCLRAPDPPTFDVPAITAACTDLATQECADRTRCSYMGISVMRTYGDMQTCIDRTAQQCIGGAEVGGTQLSRDRAEGCAVGYETFSCTDLFDDQQPTVCIPPSGAGAIGSPCGTSSECSTSFCSIPAFAVCGTCQRPPPLGSPCSVPADCGKGIACATMPGNVMGVCAAFVDEGQACITSIFPCRSGLSCVHDNVAMMTMGTCMPAGNIGDPCDANHSTQPNCNLSAGLSCDATTNGHCQATVLAERGGMCGTYTPSGSTTRVTAGCLGGGLCQKAPGSPTGICVGPAADGEACDNDPSLGLPCLSPSKCVTSGGGTAGICTFPEPAACF